MAQEIGMPGEWRSAVDAGRVKFSLGTFLGGAGDMHDGAKVTLTFTDEALRELGKATLGPVILRERDGEAGLWPVGTRDYIPSGTACMEVMVEFSGDMDRYRYGLADALELVLMEYAP